MLQKGASAPGRLEHGNNKSGNREAGGERNGPAQEAYDNRAYPATRVAYAQVDRRSAGIQPDRHEVEDGPEGDRVQRLGERRPRHPRREPLRHADLRCSDAVVGPRDRAGLVRARTKKSCTLYVGAAGGGVWMSTNAMAAVPTWKQITDSWIGSNVDRLDPRRSDRHDRPDDLRRHGRAERLQRQRGRHRPVQVDRRRRTPGRCSVGQRRCRRRIARSARSPSTRPIRTHLLIGHGRRAPRRRPRTTAAASRRPAHRTIGLYESNNGGGTWNLAFNQPQDPVDPGSLERQRLLPRRRDEDRVRPEQPDHLLLLDVRATALFRHIVARAAFEQIFADIFDDRVCTRDGFDVVRFEFATVDRPCKTMSRIRRQSARGSTSAPAGTGHPGTRVPHGASRLYRGRLPPDGIADDLTDRRHERRLARACRPTTPRDPGFGSFDFCQAQCSYDMFVVSPARVGRTTVFLGGAMQYGELPLYGGAPDISNGRAP